jgi:hypothetical protein
MRDAARRSFEQKFSWESLPHEVLSFVRTLSSRQHYGLVHASFASKATATFFKSVGQVNKRVLFQGMGVRQFEYSPLVPQRVAFSTMGGALCIGDSFTGSVYSRVMTGERYCDVQVILPFVAHLRLRRVLLW